MSRRVESRAYKDRSPFLTYGRISLSRVMVGCGLGSDQIGYQIHSARKRTMLFLILLPFSDCGLGFFFVPFCFFSSTLACLLALLYLGASSPELSLLNWDGSLCRLLPCVRLSANTRQTAAALFLFEPAVGRASGFAGRGRFFSFSLLSLSSPAVLCFFFHSSSYVYGGWIHVKGTCRKGRLEVDNQGILLGGSCGDDLEQR